MNCTAPEMIPTLAYALNYFFILLLLLLLLLLLFFFFNESATKRYIDRGRHRKSDWKTKGGGAGTDEGWGEKGNHFGVEAEKKMGIISELESVSHFAGCTIIFTFSIHITISKQRNTRFNSTQPVLLALCLPFTCFDFFACFSWKLRSRSKGN